MRWEVSVVIPVYDGYCWVGSISDSLDGNLEYIKEVILVNDGHKSDYELLLKELTQCFGDKIVEAQAGFRTGPGNARNIGLDLAKSELIAFLDCDDQWGAESLKKRIKLLEKSPHAPFVCSAYQRIYMNDHVTYCYMPNDVSLEMLFVTNCMLTSSILIRSSAVGRLRFKNIGHEDYDFLLRVLQNANSSALCLNSFSCKWIAVNDSVSSQKSKAAQWHYAILTDFKVPFLLKILLFSGYVFNAWLKRRTGRYKPLFLGLDKATKLWFSYRGGK